ncbi:MAG: DUF4241 domain-containing protein [Zymomonas sp.]|nr:MAG: DUF4241 domain-containing protein [Zymomonas sp.]
MSTVVEPLSAWTLRALKFTDVSDGHLNERGIEREAVCLLACPTGAIVGFDPVGIFDGAYPAFTRRIPPGQHNVVVYILQREEWGRHIALAELRIAEGVVADWELAWTDMPPPEWRNREPLDSYSVDSAKGCFVDAATIEAIVRDKNEHPNAKLNPVLEELIELDGADEVRPAFDPSLNIVAFSSGFGDGSYSSYWGLDAEGAPVRLVTSFEVLEEAMVPPRPPKEYS